MTLLELVFWLSVGTISYVYVGYPLLLVAIRSVTGTKLVAAGTSEPNVTLIVSAFNEEDVIEAKIRNSLELDYQRDRIEIMIVSDASEDATDDIARRFAQQGIHLVRMKTRGGKTLGLNEGVSQATGEIIVFSDANAIYDRRAIRMLVRNFEDPDVGAAVGESTYAESKNDADRSETSYWRYEIAIKRLETQIGSVVGGDGAIYAIRKSCYRPMPADALSDFVNPLQIVQQGFRCVYEPAAISIEEAAGAFDKEFRRKVRIVNRAWRAMLRLKDMLNPSRYGVFAIQLISHKVLRWLVPFFLFALLAASLALASAHWLYGGALAMQLVFYGLASLGFLLRGSVNLPSILSIPLYFCLVNLACLKGIADVYLGKSYTTWATARTGR